MPSENVIKIIDALKKAIRKSWQEEQRKLNIIIRNRGNNFHSFHDNGVARLTEPMLAYLTYKKLLQDPTLNGHHILTEDPYILGKRKGLKHKRPDFWINAIGNGQDSSSDPWLVIEFGKASNKKLNKDLSKIKTALSNARDQELRKIRIEAGYMVLFKSHEGMGKNEYHYEHPICPDSIMKEAEKQKINVKIMGHDSIQLKRYSFQDGQAKQEYDAIHTQIIRVTL